MNTVGSKIQSFKEYILPDSKHEVEDTAPVIPPYLKNAQEFSDKGLYQRMSKNND